LNLLSELANIIPDKGRVVTDEEVVLRHSRDDTYHPARCPDVVVFPKDKLEVRRILQFANREGIPVVPFGVGSSGEGEIIPLRGGISLDLGLMNDIIEVRPRDFCARVQPGVLRTQLNRCLASHGLFFPVDPGADASVGGMAATNASGPSAVRYGSMKSQVLGLEVALADGTMIRTGGMAMKSSAGYDLTALFVGSEGTLGVFTELILRLQPIPERVIAAKAVFPDVEAAGRAASAMMRSGMPMGRVELLDERTVKAVNAFEGTRYTEAPTLFLEFSGDQSGVVRDVGRAEEFSLAEGCQEFRCESDEEARAHLWQTRYRASYAVSGGAPTLSTDVCVPISELPGALREARKTIDSHGLDGAILGHVGDGNYHAVFPVDPKDPVAIETAKKVNDDIVRYALQRGGTCTGEHGVGLAKIAHLREEYGGEAVSLMRAIKGVMDPADVLNPGKIFPD
jgi:D-lactate dehydrogenase (cytochrome)